MRSSTIPSEAVACKTIGTCIALLARSRDTTSTHCNASCVTSIWSKTLSRPLGCSVLLDGVLCCLSVSCHSATIWWGIHTKVAFALNVIHLLSDDPVEIKRVFPEDKGHDYLLLKCKSWKLSYSEEEREIGDCKWEVSNTALYTPISIVTWLILEIEPDDVVD